MKLNNDILNDLENKAFFDQNEITIPKYNVKEVKAATDKNCKWIHFGAGNIFRGFIGSVADSLLNENLMDTGIIAVETFDKGIITDIYEPNDSLTFLVKMNAEGKFFNSILAGITKGLAYENSVNEVISIFENPELQMASFTVTEIGYSIYDSNHNFINIIKEDIDNAPENAKHLMSIITYLLYKRFNKTGAPLTLVSMDNCSKNGDKLKSAVTTIAKEWEKKGFVGKDFIDYIEDSSKIAFPLSMIDKITPRPSEQVKEHIEKMGFTDMDIVVTDKRTHIAPFVNAEISEYLVIEDIFTNGRPDLTKAGVILTDRETVNKVETMKVTTCLNPLHTAISTTGCLLSYNFVYELMRDEDLLNLAQSIGYKEGLKVVVDPKIIDPKQFIDEVINERFKNPYIPDTPQRIATDTSHKVGIRFGETIKSYAEHSELNVTDLRAIPLAIAMWVRYLVAIDDSGNSFKLSPDPLLDEFSYLTECKFGDRPDIKPVLTNPNVFDFDIYEIGLGEIIEEMFYFALAEKGNVRKALQKFI